MGKYNTRSGKSQSQGTLSLKRAKVDPETQKGKGQSNKQNGQQRRSSRANRAQRNKKPTPKKNVVAIGIALPKDDSDLEMERLLDIGSTLSAEGIKDTLDILENKVPPYPATYYLK